MRIREFLRALAVMALVTATAVPAAMRSAAAQDTASPEALAAARELVALISKDTIRQMVTQMIGQVWPAVESGLRAKQPSLTNDQIAGLHQEYQRIFLEYMSKLMDDAPGLYARHFSPDELHQLVAFYQSPIGQKSLHVLPQLTAEKFQMMMPRLQQMEVQINAAFTKVLQQRGLQP